MSDCFSYALNKRGSEEELRNELIGKTASMSGSDDFSSSPIELIEELKAKVASLEREKEEAYKKGGDEQAAKNSREIIASMVPRNLPQYRSDEDFDREVEYRASQLNEYTTIEDLRGLYDAKIWKHAKQLAGRTASMQKSHAFDSIYNPLDGIVGGNKIVYGKNNGGGGYNHNIHTYEPIGSQSNNNSNRYGRTASLGNNNNNDPLWYLDLFTDRG